ncbi:MAG: TIGR04076 family protein [Candidatus Heimdallarchaeota archaeon]|nr:TIGR04076 family protein [Candidatus Heimdallarchaeota archaeon]
MSHDIVLKVIKQEGQCAAGHNVGDEITISFEKNEIKGKMCLHALYSVLPKVLAMAYGAEFPWLEDADVSTHACPDAWNPLVYEVIRKRKEVG